MIRIGLLSDTHSYLDESIFEYFKDVDEIWHAGDFGDPVLVNKLMDFKPLKGVYGNIDGKDVRTIFPEKLFFKCEDVNIFMQHIGGYPGRYAPGVKKEILSHNSNLFISGHSHILKVMYDKTVNCLHMNPGAAGKQGWHKVPTVIRFSIDKKEIMDCEVIELPSRPA